MNLQKSALVAEIVGATAIVLSLIFVGVQIRESTLATYASTYDGLLSDHGQWRLAVATNPEASVAFEALINADDALVLDPQTYAVSKRLFESVLQIYERAYFARNYGRLGDAEWNRYRKNMCAEDTWKMSKVTDRRFFAEEFWDYMQACSLEEN